MIRRGSSTFAARRSEDSEASIVNPLETLANLTDVWVVLAVALMMAVAVNWGVDMASQVQEFDESAMTEVDPDFDMSALQDATDEEDFEELGTAYRGADGKIYIVEPSASTTE
jgi:hypothetical protein